MLSQSCTEVNQKYLHGGYQCQEPNSGPLFVEGIKDIYIITARVAIAVTKNVAVAPNLNQINPAIVLARKVQIL